MNDTSHGPLRYRLLVQGRLDAEVASDCGTVEECAAGETSAAGPTTSLLGLFPGSAALSGLLTRLQDLGLALIQVEQLDRLGVLVRPPEAV